MAPPRDFGHLVVVVAIVLLQRRRGHCSNFYKVFSWICIFSGIFHILFRILEMVKMVPFYRLLVAMRGFCALNALITLMLHNTASYKLLNLYFCNSFFLAFDWPLRILGF